MLQRFRGSTLVFRQSSFVCLPVLSNHNQADDVEAERDEKQHEPERERGKRLRTIEFLIANQQRNDLDSDGRNGLKRVGRQLDARELDRAERKIVWMRFAPVAAAACLVLAISFTMREYYRNQAALVTDGADDESENGPPAMTSSPPRVTAPRVTEVQGGQFVPVSEGNYFRGAAGGAVVGDENGKPVRQWRLEFEDAWHWHDPESETNVRIFRPREEIIQVPVETD